VGESVGGRGADLPRRKRDESLSINFA